MANIAVANTDAGLSGKSIDLLESDQTITGLKTFSRGAAAPFACAAGSTNVANLDADKLDGYDWASLGASIVPNAAGTISVGSAANYLATLFSSILASGTSLDLNLNANGANRDIIFKVNNSELWRMVGATGALSLTNGQISFPAAQNASAGANVLDDYEEGTWTPVISGSGGTSGQSYAVQNGVYVKIGQMVMCPFSVQLSTKGTITTTVQISGLPFAAHATYGGMVAIGWSSLATTWVSLMCEVAGGAQVAVLAGATVAATGNLTTLTTTDIGNSTLLRGNIIYRVAA